jgi:endonuclease/exonuclease/phosphatase family metal-dependent hydrolase
LTALLAATLSPLPAAAQSFAFNTDASPRLRVVTLNTAHGRKDSFNQLFLGRETLRRNVQAIAELLDGTAADVVALQEADGPSRWSGGFDHVQTVAQLAGFPWRFRGNHTESWLARYGTALLARLPLGETRSVTFEPVPMRPDKGFVIGEVTWPAAGYGSTVDVVSVHLDFLSETSREAQFEQLTEQLGQRSGPVIVLGDFNSEGRSADSPVLRFAERNGLRSYRPADDSLATFGDQRLDWILISDEFRFARYEVLPDVVSDHRAVLADIVLADPGRPSGPADATGELTASP